MESIYVDCAATTRMSRRAVEAMRPYMDSLYGNPSSLHTMGQKAAEAMQKAREMMAEALGCAPTELYFTSGGSESDNQAIRSAAAWGRKKGKMHMITTAFEHHAVLHTLKALQSEGFEVEYLEVGPKGVVTAEQVSAALREDTCLVTVMFANNEIGSILPIAEIGAVCRDRGVLFHTDAVQAVGHLPIHLHQLPVDMMSMSAHKFYGPKGIGALYVRKGAPLFPLIHGGGQERNKRAGTENVPAIVGMAAALQESCAELEQETIRLSALRDRLIEGLCTIPHMVLNGPKEHRLPGSVHVCFEGVEGEGMLLLLDAQGICASSGSACTSGSLEPSHVLLALGHPHEIAHGSLRLTLGRDNTEEDVAVILREVPRVVERLRQMSPLWQDKVSGRKPFLLP